MLAITLGLINKFKLCPQMSKEKWLQIVLYMLEKGWIHHLIEDEEVVGMWGGWRVKKYSEEVVDNLPLQEEGNILYIPFACSEARDQLIFLKELRKLRGVEKIVFNEYNKNDRLHTIKIRG